MSDKYFYNKFSGAILDIIELVQLEQYPGEVLQGTQVVHSNWTAKDWLNYYVNLYIKYIDILKKVNDVYDQIIHPQMRKTIKKFLENILCRINQAKAEIIFYNYPFVEIKPPHYIFFDDYLIEMKLEPNAIDLVIPTTFRESNSDNDKIRRILLDEKLKEKFGDALPELDITNFYFKFELSLEEAIKILQNFEVGRQNTKRITKSLKLAQTKNDENSSDKKVLMDDDRKKIEIDRLIAIQKIKKAREEELKFLKMVPENKSDNIYIKFSEENRKERKLKQDQKQEDYDVYKQELENKIKIIEGYDIKEAMKNQRRDWINKERSENRGEPPANIDLFYKRLDVEKKVELNDQQKKQMEDLAKDKLKKEQDKKKKEEAGGNTIQLPVYSGPTDQTKNLTDVVEEFKSIYETPSDHISQKEAFLSNIARDEIITGVEKAIKAEVDAVIQMEIKNLRTLKGKKEPKPKKPPKPKPEKMGPGEKPLSKIDNKELFADAVHYGVLRKMVPKNLDDLLCDFNYVATSMQIVDEQCIEIPLFYTKQLVKELCIFPLGCQMVRSSGKFGCNSILFHGFSGTGKTHAALAIAYHTDALFFDISPKNLEKFQSKEEVTKAVATAFRVARFFQPAILYFDNAEQIFPNPKVKGMPKNPNAQRLKKLFISYTKLIKPDDRIMFIGCTNKGYAVNNKDMKQMFDKTLYFALPTYSDRYLIWKTFIRNKIGKEYDLEYDVLAQMSNSYSAESIIATINYTLSKQRLERLKFNSLSTHEFVSALSKTNYNYEDEFKLNREFLNKASGLFDIHEMLRKKREEQDKGKKK